MLWSKLRSIGVPPFETVAWLKKEDPVLIDVREHSELEIARFSKEFLHIPISKVTSEYVQEIFFYWDL